MAFQESRSYTGPDCLTTLPTELLLMTSSYLERHERKRLGSSCKRMYGSLIPQLYKDDIETDDCYALLWGCTEGSTAVIESAIRFGEPIDQSLTMNCYCRHCADRPPYCVRTAALIVAIHRLQLDAVRCLISNGANVNKPDSHGSYPIHWALDVDHDDVHRYATRHDIMTILVKAGVDVEQVADREIEEAPISLAVQAGVSVNTVQLLLDHGANAAASHTVDVFIPSTNIVKTVSGSAIEILLRTPHLWLTDEGPSKFALLRSHGKMDLSTLTPIILETSIYCTSPYRLRLLEELNDAGYLELENVMQPVGRHGNSLMAVLNELDPDVHDLYWTDEVERETGNSYSEILVKIFHFFCSVGARLEHTVLPNTINRLCGWKDEAVDDLIFSLLQQHHSDIMKSANCDHNVWEAIHHALKPGMDDNDFDPYDRVWMLLLSNYPINEQDRWNETAIEVACENWDYYARPAKLIKLLLAKGAVLEDGESKEALLLSFLDNCYGKYDEAEAALKMLLDSGAAIACQPGSHHEYRASPAVRLAIERESEILIDCGWTGKTSNGEIWSRMIEIIEERIAKPKTK